MKQIRFTLLFLLLASLTLAQSVRLYPVGNDRVIADGATGTVLFVKPNTTVSLSALRSDVVQLEVNGVLFGTYLPANFLKQDGTPYSSASVAASVQAYKDAISAASGGGNSATDAAQDTKIASLTATAYQTETVAYATKRSAIGDACSTLELNAIDAFIVRGKRVGWLTGTQFDFSPKLGNSMASGLIKLTTPTTTTALVNTNLVEADFVPKKGFVLATNTNKQLGTGYIPTALGLSTTNLHMTVVMADNTYDATSQGFMVSTNMLTGDNQFKMSPGGIGSHNAHQYSAGANSIGSISYHSSGVFGVTNGVCMRELASYTPSGAVDTEITEYKALRSGGVYYCAGNIAGLVISAGLSKSNTVDLNQALREFYTTLGRLPLGGIKFVGNSISAGQTSTALRGKFSTQIAQALGQPEINFGSPSMQLTQTSGAVIGGLITFPQIATAVYGNMVLIEAGVNDSGNRDVASTTVASGTIVSDFGTKLEAAILSYKNTGHQVVVSSLYYSGFQGAGKRATYNDRIALACRNTGAWMCDVDNAMSDSPTPNNYLTDGTHLNDSGNLFNTPHYVAVFQGRHYRDPVIDFPSIAAGASADIAVTMYGTVAGKTSVSLGLPAAPTAGIVYTPIPSATDVVTLRATNVTAGAIDPPASTIRVTIALDK